MLVAETVAGGKLDFGGWGKNTGDDEAASEGSAEKELTEWQRWAAELRVQAQDPLLTIRQELEDSERDYVAPEERPQPDPNHPAANQVPSTCSNTGTDPLPLPDAGNLPDRPDPDSDDDSLIGYASLLLQRLHERLLLRLPNSPIQRSEDGI